MCLVHGSVWGTLAGVMVSESVILVRRMGKYEYSVMEVVGSLCNCAVLQAIDGRKVKDQDMTRLPRATDTYLHTSQGACARQEDRLDISALEGVVQKRGVS